MNTTINIYNILTPASSAYHYFLPGTLIRCATCHGISIIQTETDWRKILNTGMDITCLYTISWEFIFEGIRDGVHVTSDVIITYHCSA